MKNFLLATTEGRGTRPLPVVFESEFAVHFPALERGAKAACLLTGLYPGRIVLAGEKGVARRTFLDALARADVNVYADVPAELSFLLPEKTQPLAPENLAALKHPFVAWVHGAAEIGKEQIPAETQVADIDWGNATTGSGPWNTHAFWGTARFNFPLENVEKASVLDILPSIRRHLDLTSPRGDGVDLTWGEHGEDRPFFTEDWRNRLFSVTHGGTTLVCRVGGRRLPWPLSNLLWRLGVWRRRRSGARTIWDATPLVERAARLEPLPTAVAAGEPTIDGEERRRLAGLVEAHLAAYGDSEEVLGRLQDLGYL